MEQNDILINHITDSKPVEADATVDYLDKDIVLIDNVRLLSQPTATKLQMNLVAFCLKGKMQCDINGKPVLFEQNQLLICPTNTAFDNYMISPDLEFKALLVSHRMLQGFLREKMNVWANIMYVYNLNVVTLVQDEINYLMRFYDMLHDSMNGLQVHPYMHDVVNSLLRAAFLGLCGYLAMQLPQNNLLNSSERQAGSLFQRFFEILNTSKVKYHSVNWYANELCITPKYLSTVCKRNTGKTAGEWIQDHVMEDIRYFLKFTDYSIKQISDQLGFPNPSFFGKYVKEHFGMSPAKLRSKTSLS